MSKMGNPEIEQIRNVLEGRRKQLKTEEGKGNNSNAAEAITGAEVIYT